MAEIIDFKNSKDLKKIDFSKFLEDSLKSEDENDLFQTIAVILNLEEDQFLALKDGFIDSFQRTINNPNDKIGLVQALNAGGHNVDEVVESFSSILDSIDALTISNSKKDFLKQIFGTITTAISDTEGISKKYIQIPIELCNENAKIPQYANVSDSGMDVYAIEDYTINPGETKLIPTGIKLAIPPGYEIQVRPKSGRALKTKLRIANTPGTIDAGYRDEIGVIVENVEAPIKDITYHFDDNGKIILDSILHGAPHTIGKGEKFCQLVLCEVPKAALYQVESVGEIGENRGGGFGSTGLI